jgi:hypothetical protein
MTGPKITEDNLRQKIKNLFGKMIQGTLLNRVTRASWRASRGWARRSGENPAIRPQNDAH